MSFLLATQVGDFFTGLLSLVIFFGLVAAAIASAIWFFRGPAQAADRYVDALALQLNDPQAAMLFRNVYRTKEPRSTTLAWILTALLSPTVSYLYQKKWFLAFLSFVTLQGFFIWWAVALFTTPIEVVARNKRLADEAFNQVMIGRGSGYGQQVVNVNQYAYMPHPGLVPPPVGMVPPPPAQAPGTSEQIWSASPTTSEIAVTPEAPPKPFI